MVLVQNGHFSNFFFRGNIGQENVFYDILERKKAFLGFKTGSLNSRTIDIFQKSFGPKMVFFPIFFLRQCRPGKCLLGDLLPEME